jgi:hypothetical protein
LFEGVWGARAIPAIDRALSLDARESDVVSIAEALVLREPSIANLRERGRFVYGGSEIWLCKSTGAHS